MKTALKVLGGLVLALVVLVGVGVVKAWAPDRDVDSLKARWAPPPSQFVGLMGMQVHLRDEGPRNDPQLRILPREDRPAGAGIRGF